jgi:enoyl-[acyl-carrier protein] reductase II
MGDLKTRVCDLLGIEYPILQGGMAWIADASLASAVSNAGGLGIIAGGSRSAQELRREIRKCRELTDKPFGVNIMLMMPNAEEIVKVCLEEEVPVVTTGAGNPGKYIPAFKDKGIKVIPVVASDALARRMERIGCDAVIAEGMEAGGHIGKLTTMVLIPSVVKAVSIPVIAAGGIALGEQAAAVFALGAEGVQVGTRFLSAKECNVHPNYKEKILKARFNQVTVTGVTTGHPVRLLENKLTKKFAELEFSGAPREELEELGRGRLRLAAEEGDVEWGSVMAGQVVGYVNREESAEEIIRDIMEGARRTLELLCRRFPSTAGE